MGSSKSSTKRDFHSDKHLHLKTRKISNKQPDLTPKAIRERRTKNTPKLAEGKKSQRSDQK